MTRGTMFRMLLAVPLLAAGIALGAPSPAAAAFYCDLEPGESIEGGTIKDSIVVEAGKICNLYGVTVRGGVTVAPDGHFIALYSEIRGSVSGVGASQVFIDYGIVRGSFTVTGSGVGYVSGEVRGDVTINGSLVWAMVRDSVVRGSATLNDNAELTLYDTQISANLTCLRNGTFVEGVDVIVGGVRNCTAP